MSFFGSTPSTGSTISTSPSSSGGGFFGGSSSTGSALTTAKTAGAALLPGKGAIGFGEQGSVSSSDLADSDSADDSLSGYHFAEVMPDTSYTITAHRLENDLDPAMWVFAEFNTFEDFLASGTLSGDSFGVGTLNYLGYGDDEISNAGPYGDPQVTVTSPASGRLTIVVTNYASDPDDGGDGRFDYALSFSPDDVTFQVGGNPLLDKTSGNSLFGDRGADGDSLFGDDSDAGEPLTGEEPETGQPLMAGDPDAGEALVGTDGKGGSAYFAGGSTTFDFTSLDGLSFLGAFTLISAGSTETIVSELDGEERDFGLLQSMDATAAEIEVFLDLDPGTLNSLTARTPTDGAVVKLNLPTTVGLDLLEFEWNFLNEESGVTRYDDFAFFVTSDGQIGVLSSASEIGMPGSSGWTIDEVDYTDDGGPAWIAFGVVNVTDRAVDAYLGIDEVELVGVDPTSGKAMGSAFFGFDMVG